MARLLSRYVSIFRAYLGGSTLSTIARDEEISVERVRQLAGRVFRRLLESPHCIKDSTLRTAMVNIHCAKTALWRDLLKNYLEVVNDAIRTLQNAVHDDLSARAQNCLCRMGMLSTGITKQSVRSLLQSETFAIPKNMGHCTYDELVSWSGLSKNSAFQETSRKHWLNKWNANG